jgi:pimeloyl-ACP methyl ester carboxylesterase
MKSNLREAVMNPRIESPTRADGYVNAGGVRTFYAVEGAGEPLVLLHGGGCTIETFDGQTPAFAAKYRVYLPERRGHGRTPDVEGPITYEMMAADTIAFLEALAFPPAHFVGWSDGALVGLLVALRRPDLVRKLVLIGQNLNQDGARPEALALMEHFSPETFPPMLVQMYAAVSPDGPDHFAVVFEKLVSLWKADPGIDLSALARVSAPTLVLLGDDDILTIEHAAAIQRALPDSQLAVVPGASHALPMEKPELVNRLILDFLADQQVPKMMSLSDPLVTAVS